MEREQERLSGGDSGLNGGGGQPRARRKVEHAPPGPLYKVVEAPDGITELEPAGKNGPVEPLRYGDDAIPPLHRELARLLVSGYEAEVAAKRLEMSPRQVKKCLSHEPFLRHVYQLQSASRARVFEQIDGMKRTFERSLEVLEGVMGVAARHVQRAAENPDQAKIPELLSVCREARTVLEKIADRIPGGDFSKMERRFEKKESVNREEHAVTVLDQLRERAERAE